MRLRSDEMGTFWWAFPSRMTFSLKNNFIFRETKTILRLTHWRCAVFCTCPQSICQPRIHSIRGTNHKAECRLCSQSRCGIDCSRRTRSSSKLSALHFLLKNNIENCSLFESRAGLNRIRKLVIYTTEERECFSGKTRHFASFSNDN